ncbi:hypothetical protein ESZ50_01110 [Weissella muntiaci]|uniref:Uncharacterized protein n=1 Tax=Weissella muntiaci TaxID=2508881 RepID=A0A6C2CCF8_9LACO|nr:hypothetical protein [Weissella muntiaci]TYC50845.1 hypothetical protein ESZ50_01110 [Weissella muntiaci]
MNRKKGLLIIAGVLTISIVVGIAYRAVQVKDAKNAASLAIKRINRQEYRGELQDYLKPFSETNTNIAVYSIPFATKAYKRDRFVVEVKRANIDWDASTATYNREVTYDQYQASGKKQRFEIVFPDVEHESAPKYFAYTGLSKVVYTTHVDYLVVDLSNKHVSLKNADFSQSKDTWINRKLYSVDNYRLAKK